MLKDDITVLVNTCDAYSDCWELFFKSWYKHFPDHSLRMILNTETKTFHLDGLNIECFQKFKDKEKPLFGHQMNEHLKEVRTPFVIPMLEDFFLQSDVSLERIHEILNWMKNDKNIAAFYFTNSVNPYDKPSEKYPGFYKKSQVCSYRINTMGSLWRTEKLLKFSLENTTPWEWEYYGSIVSFEDNEEFYAVDKNEKPIFDYMNPPTLANGNIDRFLWGIVRGKWVVEAVEPLFKEFGIDIDYSIRGTLDIENKPAFNTKLSGSLEGIVGKKIAKDIKKFEIANKIKQKLGIDYISDYSEYLAEKFNK